MTTDTTDSAAPPAPYPAPPPRRKQRPLWPWLISLGINAVLVVVLFFLGHSVFELDTEAERERTEEVRLRELARQELERQQRAEIQLTRQQAEMLQERERRKTRDELRVQIEQMREDRREMQRLREEAFEKLRQRPLEEMVRQELEPVRREVEAARKRLEGFRRTRRDRRFPQETARAGGASQRTRSVDRGYGREPRAIQRSSARDPTGGAKAERRRTRWSTRAAGAAEGGAKPDGDQGRFLRVSFGRRGRS